MLRSSPLSCALSCALTWSAAVSAQAEDAPLPDAPAISSPAPLPEPPSSELTPSAPSAEPAAPEPAPPPAADAFPLPSAPPPAEPAPASASPKGEPPQEFPGPEERRPLPAEGLFQAHSDVHHVKDKPKDDGVDHFKIGPVVGVGVPSVISVGGTLKVTRFLGAGANLGLIPKVRLSYYGDATLSYQHVDVYARLYPFGGGFFLHGGLGYANVNGTLAGEESYYAQGLGSGTAEYSGVGKVRTPTLTALIGYFYTTSIGFSFGLDAGAQIPVAPSTVEFNRSYSLTTNPEAARPLLQPQADDYARRADQAVVDTLEKIGRTTIPTVNLRIGWIL